MSSKPTIAPVEIPASYAYPELSLWVSSWSGGTVGRLSMKMPREERSAATKPDVKYVKDCATRTPREVLEIVQRMIDSYRRQLDLLESLDEE